MIHLFTLLWLTHVFTLQAYICQGDAFLAFNNFDLAQQSYLSALHIDPSIRRSKSFRVPNYHYSLDKQIS